MSETDLTERLEACPFCGGGAKIGEWATWYVKCSDCGVQVIGLTRSEAVTAWNTRPAEARATSVETLLVEARELLDRGALSYEFVKTVGRLDHSADEGYAYPEDPDDEHDALDGLIAHAREIMSRPLPPPPQGQG